jgi:hypothetical protein
MLDLTKNVSHFLFQKSFFCLHFLFQKDFLSGKAFFEVRGIPSTTTGLRFSEGFPNKNSIFV